ncbi:primosomal protein N' [Leifsonia shinshuensis]|uniref:primosomal protein N' family DNA-binding protein n=1 Tax=Leifsonia shinshuensis TaxID=150026 RepID=UPI0028669755|nr:primosomal protein N' [Leifsonia shinshuensis]MDR6970711.1 primosomal protein N' (replication factor Y) [Leifsonia shinshuensis]
MAAAARVARVVIDSPLPQLDHLFDYAIPEELAADAVPGVRVRVPLRSAGRVADGYLVEVGDPDDGFEGTLSPLEAVVSPARVLTPGVWRLARRLADRSAGTASDILRLAVPGRMVRVEKAWLAAHAAPGASSRESLSESGASRESMSPLGAAARDAAAAPAAAAPAPAPAPVAVRGYGERVLEDAVALDERIALRAIPRLVPLPDGTWVGEWAVTLATLAADCWRGGRTAIVAVPDHRDLEQLAAALAVVAPPAAVVRADAGQANTERYRGFLEALSGPRIIIGNRSVVYAPAERLGLLVVWEDSDPLHAEPLSPYVHTRDAALVRQELEGCALVLSGNIRSVETQRLVELGWLRDVGPERVTSPKVVLTANQQAPEPMARAARIPSPAWRAAREALNGDSGRPRGPVLVQVARPGYAPVIACANCGQAARCMNCKGPLHQTRAGSPPSCTVCGRLATDWQCEHCEHRRFRMVTVGSGRTAEELGRAFPGTRVILADGDHPVQRIGSAPALVVATRGAEPIAEGGYQAVLLLDGERMLARESLHVAEDCLRWWQSAAGLAAPGAPTVLVGVSGPLARDFATGRLVEFAHEELVDRRELRFPPAVRLASVTGTEATVNEVIAAVDPALLVDVLGPAPVEPASRTARSGPDLVRAVLRFEYAHGGDVAAAVRAAVVKNATRRRRAPAGKPGYRPAPTLRVRFDDPEIL